MMTGFEKQNWLYNIQNVAAEVAALIGEKAVQHTLQKYGARTVEDLASCFYSEVFDELDFIANDARD